MYVITPSTARGGIIPSAPVASAGEEFLMLSYRFSCQPPRQWAEDTFAQAALGDCRRSQRAVTIAQALAEQPGLSIPGLFQNPYDIKAAYNLFERRQVTPDRLQTPHRADLRERMNTPGENYLLLQDTSEMSWSGNQPIPGLGPSGPGRKGLQGFMLHSCLAVRWPTLQEPTAQRPPVEIMGLLDQLYEIRRPRPAAEPRGNSKARQGRPRESDCWQAQSKRIGPAPAGVRWEEVCDRGADIFEYLAGCREQNHGFIVRAAQDRALEDERGQKAPQTLFTVARGLSELGRFELDLRARQGQSPRTARLAVAAARVRLRAPQRPEGAAGKGQALSCTVVRVWEVEASPQVKAPLERILLTDAVVETFEQGLEVALKYSARWLIEEFHKGLKTGLGAERLQLETAARLFAAIAIMSLVALRLIDLREALRQNPQAPAEGSGVLEALELEVLRKKLKRPIQTVGEIALALGRLGGHMNRKADGLPGWQTLWRGMIKLRWLVQGYLLTKEDGDFG